MKITCKLFGHKWHVLHNEDKICLKCKKYMTPLMDVEGKIFGYW